MALVRLVASLLFVVATALAAHAADRAYLAPIGFSADGRYFAAEQFGIQDGSGFAWSSITLVDLVTDSWVDGSPFLAQATEEETTESLAEIRDKAHAAAAASLAARKITVPAQFLALNGDGETVADPQKISWSTPRCCQPADRDSDESTLSLTTRPASSDLSWCQADPAPLGYRLTLTAPGGGKTLHEDGAKIPASRGCPLGYSVYAVLSPIEAAVPAVAVIAVYPFGFEGADRRFLFVPVAP